MSQSNEDAAADEPLVESLRRGDVEALSRLFEKHRERLRRIVAFRLDPRLWGRVDPEDVVQETYLAASKRLEHFRDRPDMSFAVWARLLVLQTLADTERLHLGAKKRDAALERSIDPSPGSDDTSISLAGKLMSGITSPSRAAARAELYEQLQRVLATLSDTDREVIALRHFEELTNNEVAEVLGIHKAAATNRYIRALQRLEAALADYPELAAMVEFG